MSEFTDHSKRRSSELTNYMLGLIDGEDGTQLIEKYHILTENYVPSDVLPVFDHLYEAGIETEKIKTASNKLFNILYKSFNEYPSANLKENGYLYYLKEDNARISLYLKEIGNAIKKLNVFVDSEVIQTLLSQFEVLTKIDRHYNSKENILFPQIEKRWTNSACLKLMWSFHNTIRSNIRLCIDLQKQKEFDLQSFNRVSAKVFFNIKTIILGKRRFCFQSLWKPSIRKNLIRCCMTIRKSDFRLLKQKQYIILRRLNVREQAKQD